MPNHEVKIFTLSGHEVVAGQTLKIQTSPEGEDILEELCPEGEGWEVRIQVRIEITD